MYALGCLVVANNLLYSWKSSLDLEALHLALVWKRLKKANIYIEINTLLLVLLLELS